jgi:hypothetical protein
LVRALAILGLLANAGVIALLFSLSYYVFGGPEGPLSDPPAIVVWLSATVICLAAVYAGWKLGRANRPKTSAAVVWIPPAVALALILVF